MSHNRNRRRLRAWYRFAWRCRKIGAVPSTWRKGWTPMGCTQPWEIYDGPPLPPLPPIPNEWPEGYR